MKKTTTTILQILIVLLGLAVLVFLLLEPHLEGRNVNSTVFEVYFKDAFLAYAYTASIFFFVGLYKAFMILGYARENNLYSEATVKALRTIRYCATTILVFILGALSYLFIIRPEEDIAGGVFMCLLVIAGSGTVSIVAKKFEQNINSLINNR